MSCGCSVIAVLFVALCISYCEGHYGKYPHRVVYHHEGCFADTRNRAMSEYHGHRSVADCAKIASDKGYTAFGIQNGGECWSSKHAEIDYDKHGVSQDCKNGRGGPWANDVYIIKATPQKPECPDSQFTGLRPKNAVPSCKDLHAKVSKAPSGIYWLNPTGRDGAGFQAYCDMDTAGGGWTLVYSYTFTNYRGFRSGSNAVTPRPNWPATGNIPISTTAPLSESHYAAMEFYIWKLIGREFMIKSNINHWIKCQDGSGSLLLWRTGTVTCQVVKNIADRCHDYVPDHIKFMSAGNRGHSLGPDFIRTRSSSRLKQYYYLEASTQTGNWPTHDPCGTNGANHVKNLPDPHGNIYVR